jgi:universal stress protein A
MPKITRILVPVDFSDGSKAALRHAESLARRFFARIDVLHIWEPYDRMTPQPWIQVDDKRHMSISCLIRDEVNQEMKGFLQDVPDDIAIRVYPRQISGDIVDQIVTLATNEAVDLIIMGTHGRRGLAHLFMGSVTEKVLRRAPCPVLVVRQAEEQSPLSPTRSAHRQTTGAE